MSIAGERGGSIMIDLPTNVTACVQIRGADPRVKTLPRQHTVSLPAFAALLHPKSLSLPFSVCITAAKSAMALQTAILTRPGAHPNGPVKEKTRGAAPRSPRNLGGADQQAIADPDWALAPAGVLQFNS